MTELATSPEQAEIRRLTAERDDCLEDIRALEKLIGRLKSLLLECASELEGEYRLRHRPTGSPASAARWQQDMEIVHRARAAVALSDLAVGVIPGGP